MTIESIASDKESTEDIVIEEVLGCRIFGREVFGE